MVYLGWLDGIVPILGKNASRKFHSPENRLMLCFMSGKSAIFSMLFLSVGALGQSMEPRFYSNAPTGLNFVLAGYTYSTGGLSLDPALNLTDARLKLHMPFVAYARSAAVFGKSAKFDVAVPYGFLSGDGYLNGTYVEREVDGFADPQFRGSINLIGAPALTMEEFRDYQQNFILGTSLKVTAPMGQYDTSKMVNIGQNRWSFTPELGASKAFGPLILEVAGAATFYTDNEEFGGTTKEQEPIYSIQGHVVYAFKRGIWLAVDATRYTGGSTTVGGVERADLQQSSRLGATLAFPVNKWNSIKLYASTGVSTRTGSDFNTYGAAWQYRWGGGL
jgi:hypothetical protein